MAKKKQEKPPITVDGLQVDLGDDRTVWVGSSEEGQLIHFKYERPKFPEEMDHPPFGGLECKDGMNISKFTLTRESARATFTLLGKILMDIDIQVK